MTVLSIYTFLYDRSSPNAPTGLVAGRLCPDGSSMHPDRRAPEVRDGSP